MKIESVPFNRSVYIFFSFCVNTLVLSKIVLGRCRQIGRKPIRTNNINNTSTVRLALVLKGRMREWIIRIISRRFFFQISYMLVCSYRKVWLSRGVTWYRLSQNQEVNVICTYYEHEIIFILFNIFASSCIWSAEHTHIPWYVGNHGVT